MRLAGREATQWVVRRLARQPHSNESRWIVHASRATVKRLRDEASLLRQAKLMSMITVAQGMSARRARGSASLGSLDGWLEAGPPDDAAWHASLERRPGQTRDWVMELEHGLLERVVRRGPLLEMPILLSLEADKAAELLACIESVRSELSAVRPLSSADESRSRPSARMARQLVERGEPVPTWLGWLGLLEECLWTWDEPRGVPSRPHDPIYRRDGYRCMAPGCTARLKLEAHHLVYRSRGGSDEPENLIALCLFHHQQGEHGMLARARGISPRRET